MEKLRSFFLMFSLSFSFFLSDDLKAKLYPDLILKPTFNQYLTYINYIDGIDSISSALLHNLVLTKNGEVYTWGSDSDGQLGLGSMWKYDKYKQGQTIKPILIPYFKEHGIIVTQISTGDKCSFALDTEGRVYSWGSYKYGNLGHGDYKDRYSPEEIMFFADKNIVRIISGGDHTFALDKDGQVYAWGMNDVGQLGLGDREDRKSPQPIPYFKENGIIITEISSRSNHNLALDKDGHIYAWGWNANGVLGYFDNEETMKAPIMIPYFKENNIVIKKISAAIWHSLALDKDGYVYSWGWNKYGQLGLGDTKAKPQINIIKFFKDKNIKVKNILSCSNYSLIIDESGKIYVWGYNTHGELGLGDTENRYRPTLMPDFQEKNITAISTFDHSIAIDASGDVYSWGEDHVGETALEPYFYEFSKEELELIAEKGHPHFQYKLAFRYEKGTSEVLQDYEKAFYWYEKSAEQGYTKAQEKLKDISNLSSLYDPYLIYVTKKLKKDLFELTYLGAFHQKLEDSIVKEILEEVKNSNEFGNIINNNVQENKNPDS